MDAGPLQTFQQLQRPRTWPLLPRLPQFLPEVSLREPNSNMVTSSSENLCCVVPVLRCWDGIIAVGREENAEWRRQCDER